MTIGMILYLKVEQSHTNPKSERTPKLPRLILFYKIIRKKKVPFIQLLQRKNHHKTMTKGGGGQVVDLMTL